MGSYKFVFKSMISIFSFTRHRYGYYGAIVLSITILACLSIGGIWRYIDHRQRLSASHQYEMLVSSLVNQSHRAAITPQANELLQQYPNTPYGALVILQLARQAIYQNQLPEAEQLLMKIVKNSKVPTLKAIAAIRAARVRLASGHAEQALQLLGPKTCSGSYQAACSEVKGDILLALNRKQEAAEAYRSAYQALPELESLQPLLQMKLDDLSIS